MNKYRPYTPSYELLQLYKSRAKRNRKGMQDSRSAIKNAYSTLPDTHHQREPKGDESSKAPPRHEHCTSCNGRGLHYQHLQQRYQRHRSHPQCTWYPQRKPYADLLYIHSRPGRTRYVRSESARVLRTHGQFYSCRFLCSMSVRPILAEWYVIATNRLMGLIPVRLQGGLRD